MGTRLVEISGNLPEGAEVSAEEAPLTDELLGLVSQATGSDTPEIFFALDIAILVDGARYQPNEYGESVTVNIRNIENLPGKDVSVLHLTENEQTRQLDLVESLAPQSLSEDTLEFTAESFPSMWPQNPPRAIPWPLTWPKAPSCWAKAIPAMTVREIP